MISLFAFIPWLAPLKAIPRRDNEGITEVDAKGPDSLVRFSVWFCKRKDFMNLKSR